MVVARVTIDAQEEHQVADKAIASPIHDLEKASKEREAEGGKQQLLLELVGDPEAECRLVEAVPGLDDERLIESWQIARQRHSQREQRREKERLGDLRWPRSNEIAVSLEAMSSAARRLACKPAEAGTYAAAPLEPEEVAREDPDA